MPQAGPAHARTVSPVLALCFGAAAVMVTGVLMGGWYLVSQRALGALDERVNESRFIAQARESARFIEAFLAYNGYTEIRQLYTPGRDESDELAFRTDDEDVLYAAVLDLTGLVVLHTDRAQIGTQVEVSQAAPSARVSRVTMTLNGRARQVCDIMLPLQVAGRIQGVVRIGYRHAAGRSSSPIVRAMRGMRNSTLVVVLLLAAGLAGLAWVFVYIAARPHARAAAVARRDADQRLASIGAGIVHEVKNSLNGIAMNTQLLQRNAQALPEQCREKLLTKIERIASESRRAGTVMSEFLSFAKPSDYHAAALNLPALLEDIGQFFEPECRRRGITLETSCDQSLTNIMADEQLLRHALTNLLYNAIDAVDHNGRISVRGAVDDETVRISVSDTGGGVAPEHAARLFEAFFSTKEGGAGLGLSIVQRVAQCHGGLLTLDNHPGTGCTFMLDFPLRQA